MKWFKRDKQSIPITEKTIRDVSDDNENPVTFASGLDDSEREKELEEFGDDRKTTEFVNIDNEPVSSDVEADKMWTELESELKDIEKDKEITLDDKLILLFRIYDEYEKSMPKPLAERLLADIEGLDKKLQERKAEEGLKAKEEKLHDKIKRLQSKITNNQIRSRNIPIKSTDDLSSGERKKVESKSHERIEDWEHTASLLLLEAESM